MLRYWDWAAWIAYDINSNRLDIDIRGALLSFSS